MSSRGRASQALYRRKAAPVLNGFSRVHESRIPPSEHYSPGLRGRPGRMVKSGDYTTNNYYAGEVRIAGGMRSRQITSNQSN